MSVQITIRKVPEEVRDELAARAALQGESMEEFLRKHLKRLASRPRVEELLMAVRQAKSGIDISPDEILQIRDSDRK